MNDFDVICIGVVLIDLPLGPLDEQIFYRETTMVEKIKMTTGGDALNEAVILARLGKKTALIGRIGKDMPGDFIVKKCEEEGVDLSNLRRVPGEDTRMNAVIIGKDGQRHFIKTKNASSGSFRVDEINYDFIKNARAISLASIFSSKLREPEMILKTLKTARDSGVITFADMVPMTGGEMLADMEAALPYLDYFLPNLEEAAMLTGLSEPEEMADCLLGYGIKNVVIKLGKEGCLIKNLHERFLIPGFQAKAVDTTGAGDNFAAGFISAVLDGMELKACGTFANAVAGLSTESVGAVEGVKNKEQVEAYQKEKREG